MLNVASRCRDRRYGIVNIENGEWMCDDVGPLEYSSYELADLSADVLAVKHSLDRQLLCAQQYPQRQTIPH